MPPLLPFPPPARRKDIPNGFFACDGKGCAAPILALRRAQHAFRRLLRETAINSNPDVTPAQQLLHTPYIPDRYPFCGIAAKSRYVLSSPVSVVGLTYHHRHYCVGVGKQVGFRRKPRTRYHTRCNYPFSCRYHPLRPLSTPTLSHPLIVIARSAVWPKVFERVLRVIAIIAIVSVPPPYHTP